MKSDDFMSSFFLPFAIKFNSSERDIVEYELKIFKN